MILFASPAFGRDLVSDVGATFGSVVGFSGDGGTAGFSVRTTTGGVVVAWFGVGAGCTATYTGGDLLSGVNTLDGMSQ